MASILALANLVENIDVIVNIIIDNMENQWVAMKFEINFARGVRVGDFGSLLHNIASHLKIHSCRQSDP